MTDRPRRATLFVNALALEALPDALASGADIVCVDLEDPVPPHRKDEAREAVGRALADVRVPPGVQLALRVNTVASPEGMADIQVALAQARAVGALMLPMVNGPEDVRAVSRAAAALGSGVELYAIIETPLGLEHCGDIARADPRLEALFFGGYDLSRALGCAMDWEPLLYARSRVVHAGALGGIPVMDSPFPAADDLAGLRANCVRIKALGMSGKAAKHMKHVATIREAFTRAAAPGS